MAEVSGPAVADVVGIGFGPSNIALAIALAESDRTGISTKFYEKQRDFGWHRGMLMEDATMQVSFLKDLATMRNAGSRYTFLSYLQDKGRIAEFINSKRLFPLRVEFHDYLEWAAGHFLADVAYGTEIAELRPVEEDGVVGYLDVVVRETPDGPGKVVQRARNVVVGTGLSPWLPEGINQADRIWHSSTLMDRIASIDYVPQRFVVVGSGQSAAEAVEYLHRTFAGAEVCAVYARYGYSVADDSPFANGIFDPVAVDHFFDATTDVRQSMLDYHANTNYSVVDLELSQELYRRSYQEKVLGKQRLRMFNTSRVASVAEHASGVRATVEHLPTGSTEILDADAVVYATGYRPSDAAALFPRLKSGCKFDEVGRLALERDYRVVTSEAVRCGIYVQGAAAEHSHGITAGLLSNIAVRSGEIADSILKG